MWLTPNSASESMQHRSPQPARVSCRLAAGAHAEPVHRRGDFAEHGGKERSAPNPKGRTFDEIDRVLDGPAATARPVAQTGGN